MAYCIQSPRAQLISVVESLKTSLYPLAAKTVGGGDVPQASFAVP